MNATEARGVRSLEAHDITSILARNSVGRLAFGRGPSDLERSAAVALAREHGARALARALFNANEFLHVP